MSRGFRITTLLCDGEFAPLKDLIDEGMSGGPVVNLTSANEHVPGIERQIRNVKNKVRSARYGLPYERMSKMLTTRLVLHTVRMMNYFVPKGGISSVYSPRTLVSGETLDWKKNFSIQVGQYAQVAEHEQPRNSQAARTRGAVCLGPSRNIQGGIDFQALDTGQKITRFDWTECPAPDSAIARMHYLGRDQPSKWKYTDRHGNAIGEYGYYPNLKLQKCVTETRMNKKRLLTWTLPRLTILSRMIPLTTFTTKKKIW